MSHTAALSGPSTSTPSNARRLGRSIGAVVAGLLANIVLATATDLALHALGVYPPMGQRMSGGLFALAFGYRIVYGIAGSYLTARLAPRRPLAHALVLGGIGFLLSTAGAVAMWDAGPGWYSLAVIAVCFPCAWLGAHLTVRRRISVGFSSM